MESEREALRKAAPKRGAGTERVSQTAARLETEIEASTRRGLSPTTSCCRRISNCCTSSCLRRRACQKPGQARTAGGSAINSSRPHRIVEGAVRCAVVAFDRPHRSSSSERRLGSIGSHRGKIHGGGSFNPGRHPAVALLDRQLAHHSAAGASALALKFGGRLPPQEPQ